MDRIVLDTNVLVSAAQDELSAGWRIVDAVIAGRFQAYVSTPLVREYEQILRDTVRDPLYHERMRAFLRAVAPVAVGKIPRVVAEDPEDDKVLATARAARADAIVTSDRHLLDLDPYDRMRILRPQEFLNLRAEGSSAWSEFATFLGIGPKR